MQAIDKKNIIKYINKLKIKATLVLSMKDWKKNISPKTSIVHKNKIKNKKMKGIFLNIRDMNTVLMIESMNAIIKN